MVEERKREGYKKKVRKKERRNNRHLQYSLK